jgi:beta-lactamase class A
MRTQVPTPSLLFAALAAAACGAPPTPGAPSPGGAADAVRADAVAATAALEAALMARAREVPGDVSISLIDLESGARIGIRDDEVYHAASTMKVPVLVELFRQAAEGRFDLDDPLTVHTRFTSLADGSEYALEADDDSETALYRLEGRSVPRRELARRMIVRSSNLATNLLIEEVEAGAVAATMAALGAGELVVLRGVQDIPAFERGMNNTVTARGLATLLEAIARCERGDVAPALAPLRAADCRAITDILAAQELTQGIPAGAPAGVRVANKTGWISVVDHDAAIVYPPGRAPYILVTLTGRVEARDASRGAMRDLSATVWRALAHRPPPTAVAPTELARLHARHRVDGLEERTFNHDRYWTVVRPLLEGPGPPRLERVGASVEGRDINTITFGTGPTRVLLWSQMHGNESTATMALADIFAFLAGEPDHPLARRMARELTMVAIPMLNPDGAERFERRNAMGIDINRDARMLTTPEGRVLKAVRDALDAEFGFNLHDQNIRYRVGDSDRLVAIALLAPPWSATRDDDDVRERAARVAAVFRLAVDSLVDGRIARYDDGYNPRAFGDLMQQWGTSTVLVESGGWDGDPEKQHLRLANFVGLLTALDAIATGAYADVSPQWYRSLPWNGALATDLVLRDGHVVLPPATGASGAPFQADLAIQFADPARWLGPRIDDMGDLRQTVARQSISIDSLFAHVEGGGPLGPVRRVVVRAGPEPDSPVVWVVEDGGPTRP